MAKEAGMMERVSSKRLSGRVEKIFWRKFEAGAFPGGNWALEVAASTVRIPKSSMRCSSLKK